MGGQHRVVIDLTAKVDVLEALLKERDERITTLRRQLVEARIETFQAVVRIINESWDETVVKVHPASAIEAQALSVLSARVQRSWQEICQITPAPPPAGCYTPNEEEDDEIPNFCAAYEASEAAHCPPGECILRPVQPKPAGCRKPFQFMTQDDGPEQATYGTDGALCPDCTEDK